MAKLPLILATLPSAASFAPRGGRCRRAPGSDRVSSSSSSSPTTYAGGDSSGGNADENSEYAHFLTDLSYRARPLPLQGLPSTHLPDLRSTEQDWKDWHYSFSMNGFTDFLPQFNDHISCMAIDIMNNDEAVPGLFGDISSEKDPASGIESARLPWQHDDDFDGIAGTSKITKVPSSEIGPILAKDRIGSLTSTTIDEGYDCIMDGGVMNGILATLPSTVTWHSRTCPEALLDLVKLLSEATKAIRELGIYVSITDQEVPDYAKRYLDAMGEAMGMEWTYDLDGLSKEGYHVSVARKFAVNVNLSTKSDDGNRGDDRNLLSP